MGNSSPKDSSYGFDSDIDGQGSLDHRGMSNAEFRGDQDFSQEDHMDLDVVTTPDDEADCVPVVFRWEHGGRQVYITGTFNNWERQIPMHRSGNDFTYIHNLPRRKHAYKFVVDDEWRFARDQPTLPDVEGRINNFIDVEDFKDIEQLEEEEKHNLMNMDNVFGQYVPSPEEYTKEPPPLPPHLRHIILNKVRCIFS